MLDGSDGSEKVTKYFKRVAAFNAFKRVFQTTDYILLLTPTTVTAKPHAPLTSEVPLRRWSGVTFNRQSTS